MKIDPDSEETYWETIKDSKTVIDKPLNAENAVNDEPKKPFLKVVCISDTHDQLREHLLNIPNGDVLIHAGDFTSAGDEDCIKEFDDAMARLPHTHKLVVAGNHELGFDSDERDPDWIGRGTAKGQDLLKNVVYLQDKAYNVEGINFYGSSWHPLRGYPFYKSRGEEMKEVWARVPSNTDVLITHTPPLGYLDTFGEERWGCRNLLEVIEAINPRYHVFGHVHERYGAASNGRTTFINAAQCDKQNKLHNNPIVFYIPLP